MSFYLGLLMGFISGGIVAFGLMGVIVYAAVSSQDKKK